MANLKESVEPQRGKVLFQSAKVIRSLFHDLQKRGSVVPENRSSGGIFCMSGPVAHVDDDEVKASCLSCDQWEVPPSDGFFTTSKDRQNTVVDYEVLARRHFSGEKNLPNGDIFVGSWQGNLFEGTGKYLWSDGCMYEGEWGKGKISGKGKVSWPSGATYEGDFVAGYMHGMGSYTGVDGATYRGSWKLNEKHGFGIKSYADGDVYEGSWKQGVPEGLGRYIWKNGSEYLGDWKGGVMSGRGILTWAGGDVFDGQWLDGLEHGHGTYTWADGSTYVGSWSRGLKDGKGVYYTIGCMYPEKMMSEGYPGSGEESEPSWDELPTKEATFGNSEQKDLFLEGHWSLDRYLGPESLNTTRKTGDSMLDNDGGNLMIGLDTVMLPMVEREYVQGVLINELVKANASSIKPPRKWHRLLAKEIKRPGETIFKGHRSYDLMLNLQLGIRYSVGRITPESKRDLCPVDFSSKARIWMNFPRDGSQLTPPHQAADFKWKDYCPMVFRHLRELFKIDAADYMLSICGNDVLRELSSPGKSGSVFYLSHDDRFIIKTMRNAETKVLLGMLPNYYNHVRTYDNTLITKFFGLHRVKPAGGQKVCFVVMGNMFCTELRIHRRYDLKGSSQGRSADKVEIDETTILKDLDLDFVFHLEPSWRDALLKQIDCDCKFLESERIMDYSLLLGLHFRAPQFPAVFSPRPFLNTPESPQSEEVASGVQTNDVFSEEEVISSGLVLVAHEEKNEGGSTWGPHVRGSPLRAPLTGDGEVDLLVPGTARLRIQLGVNMPARADRSHTKDPHRGEDLFGDVHDVVLYVGIIDILQEYDITKKLEHAYKSLQFDSLSISAVDPGLYSKRFQDFICRIFPENVLTA
eukprot:c24207_g2_i1 orf=853-3435(+)